jgi:hypothetical protein
MIDRLDDRVSQIALDITSKLIDQGASAVVLVGSHARGDAHPESDIDLHAIGQGPEYTLARHSGHLVSITWMTEAQHRATFDDPYAVGGAVPAWRTAVILADPLGIAASLQQEAHGWTWERIGDERIDAAAAEGIYGLAEEVHKLMTNRAAGRLEAAAIQRSLLATRLAVHLRVHLRILHDTENHLWQLVGDAMGAEWPAVQHAALGIGDEPFEATCTAAVELFALACERIWPHFSASQREVVSHAARIAGRPLLSS